MGCAISSPCGQKSRKSVKVVSEPSYQIQVQSLSSPPPPTKTEEPQPPTAPTPCITEEANSLSKHSLAKLPPIKRVSSSMMMPAPEGKNDAAVRTFSATEHTSSLPRIFNASLSSFGGTNTNFFSMSQTNWKKLKRDAISLDEELPPDHNPSVPKYLQINLEETYKKTGLPRPPKRLA